MRRFPAFIASACLSVMLVTTSAASSGSGWSKVPSPNPVAPTGQLFWVSCSGVSDCMAVGTYVDGLGTGLTLAERRDGATWSRVSTPNVDGAAVSALYGVSCTSSSACTAVGTALDTSGNNHAFAERWNGTSWSLHLVPEPTGAESSFLNAVSCTSASNCTAVGFSIDSSGVQGTFAAVWNGSAWSIQSTPNPSGAQFAVLAGVACAAATACTAVGWSDQGTIAERWDGTAWSIQSTPSPGQFAQLNSVSCASSSACTAVGFSINSSGAGLTLAEQWDGSDWTLQSTPTPTTDFAFLNSVSCTSASACTAVGAFDDSGSFSTLAERWDGTSWTQQATSNAPSAGGAFLIGVACSGASTCATVGYGFDASGTRVTLAQGWDGAQWSVQATVNVDGARGTKMYGLNCKTSVSCMAVGQSTAGTIAERWDRTAWRIVPTPNPAGAASSGLFGVSCTSPSFCIAVGVAFDGSGLDDSGNSLGTITERWDGTSWSLQSTPTSAMPGSFLNAVSCTSASACTAVGSTPEGVASEHWNGTSWSLQPMPLPDAPFSFLTGVSCTSAVACTAVGGAVDNNFNSLGTVAEQWNGTSWSLQPSPTSASANYFLSAVSCTSPSACTAVGNTDSGLLAERWNGTSWTVQSAVTPEGTEGFGDFFSSVSCSSPSACTAVGLIFTPFPPFTVAERWDGSTWSVQDTPVLPGAYDIDPPAVSCPTISVCKLVGSYTNDGPKVTLTEEWKRNHGVHVASGSAARTHFDASCRLPALSAAQTSERAPSSPWRRAQAARERRIVRNGC